MWQAVSAEAYQAQARGKRRREAHGVLGVGRRAAGGCGLARHLLVAAQVEMKATSLKAVHHI
jgi:hypothetical protein